MFKLEKVSKESRYIEMKAKILQKLENINMYKHGIYEMSSYYPDESGLPYALWFDEPGAFRDNKHNLSRVKIKMPNGDFIPVSVEHNPRILLKGTQLAKAEKVLYGKNQKEIYI